MSNLRVKLTGFSVKMIIYIVKIIIIVLIIKSNQISHPYKIDLPEFPSRFKF